MQVWTPEKLKSAARLYRLGLEPKAISAEIDVPVSRVVWIIGYRKDLFDAAPAIVLPEKRVREADPAAEGRSLVVLASVPAPRPADYEPGLDSFLATPVAPVGQPVTLLAATSRHCRWVLPRVDRSAPVLFCGDASLPGQSWCACHAGTVWDKATGTGGAAT